jgi:hypothetical protein
VAAAERGEEAAEIGERHGLPSSYLMDARPGVVPGGPRSQDRRPHQPLPEDVTPAGRSISNSSVTWA